MDPKDFFRSFFGFPNNRFTQEPPRSFEDRADDDNEDSNLGDPPFSGDRFTFGVFTNPLDMERFFNQQMETMLKNFGINDGFFSFPENFPQRPPLQGPNQDPRAEPGSRDFMLKEGAKGPGILPSVKRKDSDSLRDEVIDGITVEDLDKLYPRQEYPNPHPPPFDHHSGFGSNAFPGFFGPSIFGPPNRQYDENQDRQGFSFSFGQSMSTSRIMMPDGTVEERRTVRDSNGNETTTVTRTVDGKTTTETITSGQGNSGRENSDFFGNFFGRQQQRLPPLLEEPKSARDHMLKPIPEHEQPTYKSIFSKLFGT